MPGGALGTLEGCPTGLPRCVLWVSPFACSQQALWGGHINLAPVLLTCSFCCPCSPERCALPPLTECSERELSDFVSSQKTRLGSCQQWPEPEHPSQLLTLGEWRWQQVTVHGMPCGRGTLGLGGFPKTLGSDSLGHGKSQLIPTDGCGLGTPGTQAEMGCTCMRLGPGLCAGITRTQLGRWA